MSSYWQGFLPALRNPKVLGVVVGGSPKEEQGGEVLDNKLGFTDLEEIGRAETEGFVRAESTLIEELTTETIFDCGYIREIHQRALNHLYTFAGEYRTVNMSKEGFMFPAAKFVPEAMNRFENEFLLTMPHSYQSKDKLIQDIATVHAELLYIHPFRDGNGRTLRILANLMSYKAGYDMINFEPVEKQGEMRSKYIQGVQAALDKNYAPMTTLLKQLFSES